MNTKHRVSYWLIVMAISVLVLTVLAQSVAILNLQRKVGDMPKGEAGETVTQREPSSSQSATRHKPYSYAAPINPLPGFDDDWDPFREMQSMREGIDQMFGNAFNRFHRGGSFEGLLGDYSFSPDINIEEKNDSFIVTVNLPGLEDSKIDIEVEGRVLTISGTVKSETEEQDDRGQILRQERQSGNFYRSITLPSPVDADKVTTKDKKGVLYITLPKAE